ncbi:MAG TPA: cytochrome c oxidase subunit II [Rudaea sp.]|nr:cytochrome c oxidase subunit II [Rudaea sp.]
MTVASSALDPAADQAQAIAGVWHVSLWICAIMYAIVLIATAVVIVRMGRLRRRGAVAAPADARLGRGLSVWIALVVLGLIALAATSFVTDRRLIARDAALTIRVTGRQWWWQLDYLDPDANRQFTTANELHLPLGRTVHLELVSDDVIHSFWVPNLAGKRDLIPGRINELELTPRRIGTFRGTCAEFCGLEHAKMAILVKVEDEKSFAAWRERQLSAAAEPRDARSERGRQYFLSTTCAMCHTIRGTTAASRAGPDLTHLAARTTLAAGTLPLNAGSLGAWLADPQRQKPGCNMPAIDIEPEDLDALVGYLMSLE